MADTPIPTRRTITTLPKLADREEIFDTSSDVPPQAHQVPPSTPVSPIGRSGTPTAAPANATEAEQRFWARYGADLGALDGTKPQTVAAWIAVAERVRALLCPAPTADPLERMASAIEQLAQTMAAQTAPRGWQTLPDGTPICPKHGAPMRLREKQGDTWHSHRVEADGKELWCKGYAGKDSPGYEH